MSLDKNPQRHFFLNVVPDSYLIGILNKKNYSKQELKKKYLKVFKKEVENPKQRINNLPHYKLIEFFIICNILSISEEKELFFQFRDSTNPIFYLYKYKEHNFENTTELSKIIRASFKGLKLNEYCKFTLK